ncbi:hydroxypyruvate isomerase [Ktedonosporobacter rubrisoli]|uniref:Hydroxypyruvate isomerase n=1 Tax=Ktedonosporobacter rubrisoli TaxID=2509675 RepID=A0A4P6JTT5_KTERU|nr:TIM barrel protein [Ktedonosporobacter rubrisoli]QBD78733.1 hydroxypyruvate isomerase [Ktedonosporobacter rubrisoli]
MLRFDVNISILLKEVPFLERIAYAARLGFGAVEFWWPGEENLDELAKLLRAHGLKVALMNFAAGDMAAGERGFLNDANRHQWLREHVPQALEFAKRIGCQQLNALVGNNLEGVNREAQLEQVRENLAWIADEAARAGLGVVVESLNSFENRRYLLTNTAETLHLLAQVKRPNLKYQYDVYHMQRMEGNIIATLREHIAQIGHIQLADSPGRHEPGTGEIHYPHVLSVIDELGYQGYIGLEYNPQAGSEASFGWLPAERREALAVKDLRL